MYVPHFNAVDEATAREMVAAYAAGELITVGEDGYPLSTLLPVIWRDDTVIAHMARANPHWRAIEPDTKALLVIGGPQAYISPNWYPSKHEHGRAVPTWNYSSVHLTGRVTVTEDTEWLRAAVTDLTDVHEAGRPDRWAVTDAPEDYVDKSLRAIVGLSFAVEKVEAKAKLTQNRSDADRLGVIAGLGDDPVADAMRRTLTDP